MASRRPRTLHRSSPMSSAGGGRIGGGGEVGMNKQYGSNNHQRNRTMANGGLSMPLDKRKGQHLLKNSGILEKILNAADIRSTDTVLEIGPGTGNLTVRLLPLCRRVIALDVDPRMVSEVTKRSASLGYSNIDVREGDALRSDLGRFDVCTANLPYQISSPFIFRLLAHRPLFRLAVLMFQKEFADRLLALPNQKNYGRLAINVRLFCVVTKVCKVSAGSFNPPPQVDSAVVKITPRIPTRNVDFREWDGMIRICFSKKRKTLRSVFKSTACLNMLETNYKTWCSLNKQKPIAKPFREVVQEVLAEQGLSDTRSISLDFDRLYQLQLAFNRLGIYFVNVANTVQQRPKDDRFAGIDEFSFYDDEEKEMGEEEDDGESE